MSLKNVSGGQRNNPAHAENKLIAIEKSGKAEIDTLNAICEIHSGKIRVDESTSSLQLDWKKDVAELDNCFKFARSLTAQLRVIVDDINNLLKNIGAPIPEIKHAADNFDNSIKGTLESLNSMNRALDQAQKKIDIEKSSDKKNEIQEKMAYAKKVMDSINKKIFAPIDNLHSADDGEQSEDLIFT